MYNSDPQNLFLAIATNIPQWLKTGFVLQGYKGFTHVKKINIVTHNWYTLTMTVLTMTY